MAAFLALPAEEDIFLAVTVLALELYVVGFCLFLLFLLFVRVFVFCLILFYLLAFVLCPFLAMMSFVDYLLVRFLLFAFPVFFLRTMCS